MNPDSRLTAFFEFYIEPVGGRDSVLPLHRTFIDYRFAGMESERLLRPVRFRSDKTSPFMVATESEVVAKGPGRFSIESSTSVKSGEHTDAVSLIVQMRFGVSYTEKAVEITAAMVPGTVTIPHISIGDHAGWIVPEVREWLYS